MTVDQIIKNVAKAALVSVRMDSNNGELIRGHLTHPPINPGQDLNRVYGDAAYLLMHKEPAQTYVKLANEEGQVCLFEIDRITLGW